MSFPVRAIAEFSDVQGGLQLTHARATLPIEVPYLRVANVFRDRLDLGEIKRMRVTAAELERTALQSGDLLLVEGHGNPEEIGRSSVWLGELMPCVHQNHLIRVRVDGSRALPKYVSAYLNSPVGRQHLVRAGKTTSGLNTINISNVREVRVPLPPLPEQRRIADILDKADAIRRKRKEAIALTEELLRSAFLEMFGDPVTNPKGWPLSTFGNELEGMEYGPRFYNEKYSEDGVRIVRITDLNAMGSLDFDSMPRLSMPTSDRARYALKPGEVIFARTGATVGKTALIEPGMPECVAGAYFIRLRFKKHIAPRYARMVLASDRVQDLIARRSRQSAQQNFSGPGIRELPLPVPPIDLQHRLEAVAAYCAKAQVSQRRHADAAEDLFNVLVHRAFRGELTQGANSKKKQLEMFTDAGAE